jgi:hypothetical protein
VTTQHCLTMDASSATMQELGGGTPHRGFPLDAVSLARVLADPADTFARPMHWRMKHR